MQPWFTATGNRMLKQFEVKEVWRGEKGESNFLNSRQRTLSKNAKCMSRMKRVVNEWKFKFPESRFQLFAYNNKNFRNINMYFTYHHKADAIFLKWKVENFRDFYFSRSSGCDEILRPRTERNIKKLYAWLLHE